MELIDRFGILPQAVKQLFSVHQIRLKAEHLGITKIDINANGGYVEFSPDTPVQAISIIQLMKQPTYYRMEGGQRLKLQCNYRNMINVSNLFRIYLQNLLMSCIKTCNFC
jgi:transcription-repair coupling factor (superfamily II helicase)